ncbi:MAG: hypothetical protein H6577_06175 [Lewinellaceae bacterium]|nr:hypothetical protein [Saprospiraceae bacterium]MCB9337694.1 hypothetical protein [Lewinellaceae bacterium]
MVKFKSLVIILFLGAIALATITSCEKDEGKLPDISFKTGGSYVSADTTLPIGSTVTMGIDAAKTEDKDVLKRFNISKSINGGTAESVFDKDLSGSEGDNYSYDFTTTLDSVANQVNRYTFTVTNRDGLTNQVSLSITLQ